MTTTYDPTTAPITKSYDPLLGNSTAPTITSESLQNNGTPVIPPPTPDPTNHAAIVSGAAGTVTTSSTSSPDTTYTDKSKSLLDSILGETSSLSGKTQYTQEQLDASGATALQKRQNELAGQLTALNKETEASKLQNDQNNQGLGVTQTIGNRQSASIDKTNAIKALTISSEYALNAGNLDTAKQNAQRAVDLKYKDTEDALARNTQMLQLYSPFMTAEQKTISDNKQIENQAKLTALADNKKLLTDVVNAAQASGQSSVAAEALKLDPNSTTFISDLAKVQSKVVDPTGQLDVQLKRAQLSKLQAETKTALTQLPSSVQTKVQTVAGQFDAEQAVKQYQTIAETIDAVKSAGSTPTDDIQRIYAFAKVMDPNSAVREGEYKTVADYSSALLSRIGLKIERVFDNKGFLTPEARSFISTTLDNRLASSKKAYDNIYSSYGSRINKITGNKDGTEYITDYAAAFNTKAPANSDPLNLGVGDSKANNPLGI